MRTLLLLLCLAASAFADAPMPGRYSGTLRKNSLLPAPLPSLITPALVQRVVARIEGTRIFITVPTPSGPDYFSLGAIEETGAFNIYFAGVGVVTGQAVVTKAVIRLTFTRTFNQPDETGQPVQFQQTYSFTLRRIGS